jgi:hypothetical protein
MKFYLVTSIIVALYVLFFMPSMLIYFLSLAPFEMWLARLDNQVVTSLIKNLMLLVPLIPAVLIIVLKKLYRFSVYSRPTLRNPIILLSFGHLGLIGIIFICLSYSQLAGWLSIPVYIYCSIFYGIGFMKVITVIDKNA